MSENNESPAQVAPTETASSTPFGNIGSSVTLNVPTPVGGPTIITRESIIEVYGQNRR